MYSHPLQEEAGSRDLPLKLPPRLGPRHRLSYDTMRRRLVSIILSLALLGTTGYRFVPDYPMTAARRGDVGIEQADDTRALLFIPADGQTTLLASRSQRASREPMRVSRPMNVINSQLQAPSVPEPTAHQPAFHRKQPLTRSLSDPSPAAA